MIEVHWVKDSNPMARGNALGYSKTNAALKNAASKYVKINPNASVAFHYNSPTKFEPIPDKFNILYTMTEKDVLDPDEKEAMLKADMLMTPSSWCRNTFEKEIQTIPVHVVPLGVDTNFFAYRRRRWKGPPHPFRWLYIGAANQRKTTLLTQVDRSLLSRLPWAFLYMKVTTPDPGIIAAAANRGGEVEEGLFYRDPARSVDHITGCQAIPEAKDGDIFDCRFLDDDRIRALYYSAHGFILPSCGEGWGQTGLEAMATGCPTVVTEYSGIVDWAHQGGVYFLEYDRYTSPSGDDVGMPTPESMLKQMGHVMMDYRKSQKVAKKGSEQAREVSWDRAARQLCQALASCGKFPSAVDAA